MGLNETFERMRPSIVALGSRLAQTLPGDPPAFPNILGTGFVVDERGILMTNRHVADALKQLPPSCAIAIIFPDVEPGKDERAQPVLFRQVKAYNLLESFDSVGPFYGELLPDVAFVQIDLRGLQPLGFNTAEHIITAGREIATAGFAMGTSPLVLESRVIQLMPFLRRGIVSSVHPFPAPHPHGFTIDIMTQGGESGSPIFLPDTGEVVGMIYAGFNGTNITIAVPSSILEGAVKTLKDTPINLDRVEELKRVVAEYPRTMEMRWETLDSA